MFFLRKVLSKPGTIILAIEVPHKSVPYIALYHIEEKKYRVFRFIKPVEGLVEAVINNLPEGNYVVLVGFVENNTFYYTDIDSIYVPRLEKPVPTPPAPKPKPFPWWVVFIPTIPIAGYLIYEALKRK